MWCVIKMMKAAVLLALLSLVIICVKGNEELAIDQDSFKQFCKHDEPTPYHKEELSENFCHCEFVTSPMIGRPTLRIDCMSSVGVNNLTNEVFAAEKLPLNTMTLILSYQSFTSVPEFSGDLTELDLSNNNISIIKESNFGGISSLEQLYLSYNRISEVLANAFSSLTKLHHLDLSNNLLVVIPANTFAPLITLNILKLSSNEGFGRLMGRDNSKSSLIKLYHQLGVTISLKTLEMERCNLKNINLVLGSMKSQISPSLNCLATSRNLNCLEILYENSDHIH
jgi:Leucine-rich repeat (LRR) protein